MPEVENVPDPAITSAAMITETATTNDGGVGAQSVSSPYGTSDIAPVEVVEATLVGLTTAS